MKPPIKQTYLSAEALQQSIDDISPILDNLPPDMLVMAENLFPIVIWEGTTDYQHTVMGTQLSYLVSKGQLQLERLPDKRDGKKRYRTK